MRMAAVGDRMANKTMPLLTGNKESGEEDRQTHVCHAEITK